MANADAGTGVRELRITEILTDGQKPSKLSAKPEPKKTEKKAEAAETKPAAKKAEAKPARKPAVRAAKAQTKKAAKPKK